MELAYILAVLALIALAVLVIQGRPSRRRRRRDDWEIDAYVREEDHPKSSQPDHRQPVSTPTEHNAGASGAAFVGSKALSSGGSQSGFWAAIGHDGGDSDNGGGDD